MTDEGGAKKARYDYMPFGEEITRESRGNDVNFPQNAYPQAAEGVSQRFTGKERDAETGLDYFGARYMSGAQGRFTSPDPFNLITDSSSKDDYLAHLSDPQTWNKYAYVRNNPLRYVDPDGRDFTIVYSDAGLSDEDRKLFRENRQAILDAVKQKFEDAGIKNVTFVDRASLSREDQKRLDSMPLKPGLLDSNRSDSPVAGFAQLNFLGDVSSLRKSWQSAFGFTNAGRAEVFVTNVKKEMEPCGFVCAMANVSAHELGHTLGMDPIGHLLPSWSGEIMNPSNSPGSKPLGFDMTKARNRAARERANNAKPGLP